MARCEGCPAVVMCDIEGREKGYHDVARTTVSLFTGEGGKALNYASRAGRIAQRAIGGCDVYPDPVCSEDARQIAGEIRPLRNTQVTPHEASHIGAAGLTQDLQPVDSKRVWVVPPGGFPTAPEA